MTTLLVFILTQVPPTVPPLGSPPLAVPASASFRVPFVGAPGVVWRDTEYVIAWKDQRRAPSGSGPATIFLTTFSPTASSANPTQGRPMPGGPPALPNSEPLLMAATATQTFVAHVIPSPDGGTALVIRATTDGGVFGQWSANLPSLGVSRFVQLPTLATTSSSMLAAWYSEETVHLSRWPGGVLAAFDAGPDVSSLSAGQADGGYLIAWTNGLGRPIVTRVDEATLTPIQQDDLGLANATRVQVVSSPQLREVGVLVGSSFGHWVHDALWSLPFTEQLVVGSQFAAITAPRTTTLSAWSTATGRWVRGTPLMAPGSSRGQVPLTPSHRTLAFANDGQDGLLLSTLSDELYAQRLEVDFNGIPEPTVTPQPPVSLLRAPAAQRFPSAVWSDDDRRFLVAWDESQPDASFQLMTAFLDLDGGLGVPTPLANAAPTPLGSQPVLLRNENGGLAIQSGPSPGSRTVYTLARDGGFSVGPALGSAGPFSGALLGDQVAVQWGSTTGDNTLVRVGSELFSRFDQPGIPPACGVARPGFFWLPVATDAGILYSQVVDGLGVTVVTLEAATVAVSAICAAVTPDDAGLMLAWRTLPGLMVRVRPFVGGGPSQAIYSNADSPTYGPLVVPTRTGVLIAWASDSLGVRAAFFDGNVVRTPVTFAQGEVANLSVASSPIGVAAVLWDRFDADAGARRVELRLVDTPQGTMMIDAGTLDGSVIFPTDAGGPVDGGVLVDGGVTDGGVTSGTPDAGADGGMAGDAGGGADAGTDAGAPVDAGPGTDAGPSADAGAPDGGATDDVFVPACGCGAPGSPLVLLLTALLGLATRRGRRTGREDARTRFR